MDPSWVFRTKGQYPEIPECAVIRSDPGIQKEWTFLMFLVPLIGKDYKWYISGIVLANWVIIYHRSHLLREPETAKKNGDIIEISKVGGWSTPVICDEFCKNGVCIHPCSF